MGQARIDQQKLEFFSHLNIGAADWKTRKNVMNRQHQYGEILNPNKFADLSN